MEHKVTASRSWALGARCEDYLSCHAHFARRAGTTRRMGHAHFARWAGTTCRICHADFVRRAGTTRRIGLEFRIVDRFFFASFSLHFLLHFRSKCDPCHCRFWVTFEFLLCRFWITLEHKVTASRSWALGARCEDYPSYYWACTFHQVGGDYPWYYWACTFRQVSGDYPWCWT